MLKTLHVHLTGNIVGYVALFIALSSSAYAMTTLPVNSVESPQIKNKSVLRADLSPGIVTKADAKWMPGQKFIEGAAQPPPPPLLINHLDTGSYLVIGKLTILVNNARSYSCRLTAGPETDSDTDSAVISNEAGKSDTKSLTLMVVHTATGKSGFDAKLECPNETAGVGRDTVVDMRIMGIRIMELENSTTG